jgi:c(7)-type cytochrome triheme protein
VRFTKLAILTLMGAVALSLLLAAPAESQPKIPADIVYEGGKDSPGPVTFSHKVHQEAGAEKCTACHTKIFKMKKGPAGTLTMAKMNAGEQCGACHDGKTEMGGKKVFAVDDKARCESCHKKS